MKISRVCISDSIYSLLFYLLFSSEKEIEETFFFFSDGIHESIRKKFKYHEYIEFARSVKSRRGYIFLIFRRIYLNFFSHAKWPFLRTARIFALDYLYTAIPWIGKRTYTHIADGPNCFANLKVTPEYQTLLHARRHPLLSSLGRFVFGHLWHQGYGVARECELIMSSTPDRLPEHAGKVSVVYPLEDLWKHSSDSKKKWILNIFNVTENELNEMRKRDTILLTQQLATEGTVSEEELVSIYRKLLTGIAENQIVIKRHPRDRVNYKKYFPQAFVYDKFTPMQIFTLEGISFKTAVTIFSSSALSLGEYTRVIWGGTDVHPEILKRYGKQ